MAIQPTATDSILRWPEVQARVPISRSHAHSLAAQGKFPKPIKLGPRASGWIESEIDNYITACIARSRPETPNVE